MKSTFFTLLIFLFVFAPHTSNSQALDPDYCGDQIVVDFVTNASSSIAGSLTVGNDDQNLYLTYEAAPGWDFYSNASFVGQLSNVPYYGFFTFHYYNNITPNNENTAVIPKTEISMDENGCFVVSAFAYAVNASSGFSNNVWAFLSYDPERSVYYSDYCWQECDQKIEIAGTGVKDIPVATLTFPDPESISSVRVEAIYKDVVDFNGPVEFSNALGDVYQVLPQSGILNYDRQGDGLPFPLENKVYFTAVFNRVDENGIILNQLNNAGSIHSFIAYVSRIVPENSTPSILSYHRAFFYRNNEFPEPCASNYPPSTPLGAYEANIAVPPTVNPKNITLSIPITELADDERNGFILVSAGAVNELIEFETYNDLGNALLIETVTLPGVPGDVDLVNLKIWSPCDEDYPDGGDSFFTSAVLLDYTEEECYPCDGQISELTLEYLGSETDATVKVYSKKVEDDKLIATFENVNQGDALSFTGTGNQNKMGSKIRITINDENNNYTEIHTSCSQPIGVGMVFSNKSGSEQTFEILAGESVNGGPICTIGNPGPEPCGPCDGQVTALTLKYLGIEEDITIKVYKDKVENDKLIAAFTGINPNDEFSFIGVGKHNKMGAKIRITINDDNGNYTEIHTSCSQPIGVGMVFDDLYEIIAGASKDGGPLCETGGGNGGGDPCGPCDGQVTALTLKYLGVEEEVTIKVYKDKVQNNKLIAEFTGINPNDEFSFIGNGNDNKLGAKIRITINDDNGNYTEIHTSCSQPIGVGMVFDDLYEIIAGTSKNGGPLCEIGGGNGGGDPCGPCDGQMTSLTLQYLGDESDATINVYKKKVEYKSLLATFTGINNGDEITFAGTGKHNKLGSKVRLTINEVNNNYTEIHTSCSQPIAVGMTYWDKFGTTENFLLTAGTSHEGGDLCEEGLKSGEYFSPFEFDDIDEDPGTIIPEFKVYPNPMKTFSNVEFVVSETGVVQLELINLFGNRVKMLYHENCMAGAHYVIKVNAQELPKGIYFVRMINGNEVLQKKIQVIR